MNDDRIDLSSVTAWLADPALELRSRILQRLGTAPRALPGRTILALERWSLPVAVVAVGVCVLSALALSLDPAPDSARSIASLFDTATRGGTVAAADVYLLAGQVGP